MKRWVGPVMLVLLPVFLVLVMMLSESARRDQEMTPLTLSPSDSGRGGGLAWWLLAEAHGVPVQQKIGWVGIPANAVVVWRDGAGTDPVAVRAWVGQGGTLVVLPTGDSDLLRSLGVVWKRGAEFEATPLPRPWNGRLMEVATHGGRLSECPGWTPVVQDGDGVVLAERREGHGHIWILADLWCLSNEGIDGGANADLALSLIDADHHRPLTYAEPPHIEPSVASSMLGSPALRQTVGWLLALGVLYVLQSNVRFGRPRVPQAPPSRSELEYVEALGAIYQESEDAGLAVDACYRWMTWRVMQRLGLRGLSKWSEVLPRLEARYGLDARELAEAVAAIEHDRDTPVDGPSALQHLQRFQRLLSRIDKE